MLPDSFPLYLIWIRSKFNFSSCPSQELDTRLDSVEEPCNLSVPRWYLCYLSWAGTWVTYNIDAIWPNVDFYYISHSCSLHTLCDERHLQLLYEDLSLDIPFMTSILLVFKINDSTISTCWLVCSVTGISSVTSSWLYVLNYFVPREVLIFGVERRVINSGLFKITPRFYNSSQSPLLCLPWKKRWTMLIYYTSGTTYLPVLVKTRHKQHWVSIVFVL